MKNIMLLIAALIASACATTPTMKSVAGTYEGKIDGNSFRVVLLNNGLIEGYIKDKEGFQEGKWSISEEGELHCVVAGGDIGVYRINEDGGITLITYIEDGNRTDIPKEEQPSYKKLNNYLYNFISFIPI